MHKIYLLSLGCPKNLVDSEILSALLKQTGFELVDSPQEADLFIITTCAFIQPAVEESIETILELAQLKNEKKKLIVAGCLVERYKEKLPPLLPEVDAWIGLKALPYLPEWLKKGYLPQLALEGPGWEEKDYTLRLPSHPFSAYVKIAEGCSNYCCFCTIPFIRGPLKSRPMQEIVREVERLAEIGIKEIILVAQETTAYGMDIYGKPVLAELLEVLDKIGIPWLRLLYAHPKRILPLISAFKRCQHLTPYLDVPIQHVDEGVLKKMGRRMGEKELRKVIWHFKQELPHIKLRTTVMVGFPNETEAAFKKLKDFLAEVAFDHLGVFKYYAEEGTAAYKLGDPIAEEVKERRYQELIQQQFNIVREKHTRYLGQTEAVFIERMEEGYKGIGRTAWQAPEIDGEVYIVEGKVNLGEIVPVKIVDSYDYDLIGEVKRKD
jgi:ribosomal protein S12 methylthiotransferase